MNSNAMNPERIAELIRAGLPGATVRVLGASGPPARWAPDDRLGALVGREIHALSIEALTPDELAVKSR